MVWNLWSERRLHIKFTTEKQVLEGIFLYKYATTMMKIRVQLQ
jgi:hypothetical protein